MTYAQLRRGLFRGSKRQILNASPPVVLIAGFLALITIGTILLALPVASSDNVGLFQAFFMATSAVTVTGLTVINPATELKPLGQAVLTILVQLGGLGFVTFAVLTSFALGRKLSIRQQKVALQAFNQTKVSHIKGTAIAVIKITFIIEVIAAVILSLWWWREMEFTQAVKQGVFHAITSFNNSGFSLFEDGLHGYASDAIVILVITTLIILGGVGFSVLHNVIDRKHWSKLLPYTKAILIGTLVLNLMGFVAVLLLETNNPATLGALPTHGKVLSAWMQAITARTAGFTTIDISQLHDSSTLLMLILMFIGGGSLSTASGIKLGTFIVLLAAMWSYVKQSREVTLMKRSIDPEIIQKSLALVMVSVMFAMLGFFLLTLLEDKPFLDLLFETISALSTTGMSRNNLTPELSIASQAILTIMMFAGRIGPLTLVYSLATRKTSRIRYPVAEFPVG